MTFDAVLAFALAAGPGRPGRRSPLRRRLLDRIRSRPGIHGSELARDVEQPWATVQYHLRLLRQADLVTTVPSGREQRLFADDVDPTKARLLCLLDQGRRGEILEYLQGNPGAKQVEVCDALGLSRKTFRNSVHPLLEEGLLEERRGIHSNQYFAAEALEEVRQVLPLDPGLN